MVRKRETIKEKGFDLIAAKQEETPYIDFSKIKVGVKSLSDAVLTLGNLKKTQTLYSDKSVVLNAIYNNDLATMRAISDFFYRTSGIYSRLVRYLAYLYRYDWLITPYGNMDKNKAEKVKEDFNKILNFLDNFEVKRLFGEIALKVIRHGCYYGYKINSMTRPALQELPPDYCRSRYKVGGRPAIEFNMKYFDDAFMDKVQRMKMLELFGEEFKKGYSLYKKGKLKGEYPGDQAGWYLLSLENAIKFNINDEDFPMLISVIPAIMDLDAAKDLDKTKMEQELLKIIIQKMPFDKNGDLIFDVDEARELHNNAIQMLGKAIGIDVLTTFADVDVEDMADNRSTATTDDLERVERSVYNEAGISQMQFNTDGNIALEKSILNDEATIYNLIVQFESFLNDLIQPFNKKPKNLYFRVQILTTTIYNYKEMAKLYKEQTQLGYSKMLPQIALGQSQSSILANAYFENDILDLVNVFIPPLMSSTMNADFLTKKNGGGDNGSGGQKAIGAGEEKKAGRKEKDNDQKSEKTIANREAMN